MMKLFLIVFFCFCQWLSVSAETAETSIPLPNTGIAALNSAVRFYTSFDNGLDADMASGMGEPLSKPEKPQFHASLFGKALVFGDITGSVTYKAEQNIDFTRPGALSFWLAPLSWIKKDKADSRGYLRFFTIAGPANRGIFTIQRMGFSKKPQRTDTLWVGFGTFPPLGNWGLGVANTLDWRDNDWHLVIVNWDLTGIEVSVDGKPFVRRDFPAKMSPDAMPDGGVKKEFTLGGVCADEQTLIDEFVIYKRNLSFSEAQDIFKARSER